MARLFKLFALPILGFLLLAICSLGAVVSWEVGQLFGGGVVVVDGYDLTSGHVLAAVLVGLGLTQLLWGPMVMAAWRTGDRFIASFALGMVVFCFIVSGVTGLAWLYARADLMTRQSQADLQKWSSSTQVISRLNQKLEIEPRARGVISAEMAQVLATTVKIRGKQRSIKSLTAGCANAHWATRHSCAKYLKLSTELAGRQAFDQRAKNLAVAEEKQTASLHLNTSKFFEYFETYWGVNAGDQLNYRMLGMQGIAEVLSVVLPVFMAWLFTYQGKAPHGTPRNRHAAYDAGNDAGELKSSEAVNGAALRVVHSSVSPRVDKTAILRRFLAQTSLTGCVRPDDFIAAINEWCGLNGHNRFHKRHVGQVWLQLGGSRQRRYVPTTNNNTSSRTDWVMPGTAAEPDLLDLANSSPVARAA